MNEMTRHIAIDEFDYPLPDERIAKFPLTERDSSKLLLYREGEVSEVLPGDGTVTGVLEYDGRTLWLRPDFCSKMLSIKMTLACPWRSNLK